MIRFSFDPEARAAYVAVDQKGGDEDRGVVDWTKTISEEPMITVDRRADGSLYGIEILLPQRPGGREG